MDLLSTTALFRTTAAFFATMYIKYAVGYLTLRHDPFPEDFVPSASAAQAFAHLARIGIRDVGMGALVLALLAATCTHLIADGDKATALVIAARAGVLLGDWFIVRSMDETAGLRLVVLAFLEFSFALGLGSNTQQ